MAGKWCVYEHKFPNGKRYIGITSTDPEKRWRGGKGYETQRKMWNAILKYGWDNVEHNILIDGLSKDQAEWMERYLIAALNTIDCGYNVAVGGSDCGNGTYLYPYLLDMVRADKEWFPEQHAGSVAQCVSDDRHNKELSDFWNSAMLDVTRKWGVYSTTDEMQIACFWHHMSEWVRLNNALLQGKDMSGWVETAPSFEVWTESKPHPSAVRIISFFDL